MALNRTNYMGAVGRILLSAIFIISGLSKIIDWNSTAAFMASKGMPAVPLLLAGAIAVELLGGLSLLLGYRTRWGALALFLFLIPTTLIFHNFWAMEGMERMNQMQHFLKNLTIMGGLLVVASLAEVALRAKVADRPHLLDMGDTREVA